MIFLIEYDRPKGHIVKFKSFNDSEQLTAEKLRLTIELDLRQKAVDHEVVLLNAANEDALRRTHRRYFEDAGQIGRSISDNAA